MTAGPLKSDHVNYLILRYLQEAGHENAAVAFYRDWHRPHDYRDPENLPFAPAVRRHELISVIQDGLLHDEMVSRVRRNERRFQWANVEGRVPGQAGPQHVMENGASRPVSSGKRKVRPPAMPPPDEFPTPPPKRQRRSEDTATSVRVNGEQNAMDVDAAASPEGEGDEDGEEASPAVGSETEVIEVPPERYDSMDVAVQTDVQTGPKTSTLYWKVDKPDASIFNAMWSPVVGDPGVRTLFTVGESLCRFYEVTDDSERAKQVTSIDEPPLPSNSIVTASAWHPRGHTVALAVDTVGTPSDGQEHSQQAIILYNRDQTTSIQLTTPPLIHPTGIALALRFDDSGRHLLVARTNLKRGYVAVYCLETLDGNDVEDAVAWHAFDRPLLDATWHHSQIDRLIVCGGDGLVEDCSLETPPKSVANGFAPAHEAAKYCLERSDRSAEMGQTKRKWDKVRANANAERIALASSEDRVLAVMDSSAPLDSKLAAASIDLPGHLTALVFQPRTNDADKMSSTSPALLAAAFEDGQCVVYSVAPSGSDKSPVTPPTLLTSRSLPTGLALALAWSPDGAYLAVGGPEVVQIFQTDSLGNTSDDRRGSEAFVTWRPDAGAVKGSGKVNEVVNGDVTVTEDSARKPLSEPSLEWSADGGCLVFALERQIAVIRCRPSLNGVNEAEQNTGMNGHASPKLGGV